MRAGQLRERITVQSRTLTTSTSGDPGETWATVATVWARAELAAGGEAFEAERTISRAIATFTLRYDASLGLAPAMRIVWNGANWNIHDVVYDDRKRMWILQTSKTA